MPAGQVAGGSPHGKSSSSVSKDCCREGGEEGVLHGSDQYHVFRFGGVKGGEGEGGLGWDGHWELVVRLQTTEGGYEGG